MKRHRICVLLLAVLACICLASCATGSGSIGSAKAVEPLDDSYRNYYEIFVWSFYDTDNDGIGDLNGVRRKLSYIKDLGFNGIWLMPITVGTSYHKYDVENYYDVDPQFGTLDDMKALVALHDDITLVTDDTNPAASPMEDMGDDFLAPMPAPRQTPTFDLDKEEKSFDQIAQDRAEQPHESKEDIKAKKQRNNEISDTRNADNTVYVMLKFDTVDDQLEFCDLTGYRFTASMIIDGKEFMQRLGL